jgi:glycosyltransferase involved in cell wall biosynthesis
MNDDPIVHIVPSYPPHLGGMENVASSIAEEFAKVGRVEVITTNCGAQDAPRLERRGGLTIHRLRALEISKLPIAPGIFLQAVKFPRRTIVHVHVAQALTPEMAWIARWLRRGTFIAHFHLDVPPSSRLGRIFFVCYKRYILGCTLRAAAKVITFSVEQADFLKKTYHVKSENIAIIPNGIGPEFVPAPRADIPANRPLRVLYVGRLSKQKALPRLVHALAAMTEPVEALLVGEGDERPDIEDLVRRCGLDNVRLPGRRHGSELVATYQWADVFVLPSDREGMPLVALEAMACGLPVVATDVVGNRELLTGIGILVQPDPAALASALDQVVKDEALRSELGKRSLAAAENYTVERSAEHLRSLYAEVAGQSLR